jgi:hypothetical protein
MAVPVPLESAEQHAQCGSRILALQGEPFEQRQLRAKCLMILS